VLSGGYEDDVDNGDEFFYTGSGGRDLSGNKRTALQSCDQELTRYNRCTIQFSLCKTLYNTHLVVIILKFYILELWHSIAIQKLIMKKELQLWIGKKANQLE